MKSTRFTERLNFEKKLKSTVWGREFQQLITRSLKKLARFIGLALIEFKFITKFYFLNYWTFCKKSCNFFPYDDWLALEMPVRYDQTIPCVSLSDDFEHAKCLDSGSKLIEENVAQPAGSVRGISSAAGAS